MALAVFGGMAALGAFGYGLKYLDDTREHDLRDGPCIETATMVATTAGSPNVATCPNIRHKMRVVPATVASAEEAAATVFCECVVLP